ncbi:unnamed protein product [Ectocarpus sp. CCAP 1310/34]|nr:unnamed protein product [Ectocarpus sp. CCAP 1310/34]
MRKWLPSLALLAGSSSGACLTLTFNSSPDSLPMAAAGMDALLPQQRRWPWRWLP